MEAVHQSLDSDLQALRRGDLAGARELHLPGLAEFPREIFGLADTLELLDLSGGSLSRLPEDLGRLSKLRVLFCSGNQFEQLPEALGDCGSLTQIAFRSCGLRIVPEQSLPPNLRWLTLTENRIERLPVALGARPRLQKLMLAGNALADLPDSLADAPSLELVRLSSNFFESLPPWLARLPKLAWISWNGNPLERDLAPAVAAAPVLWADLDIGERLGGGASGHVHRAAWRAGEGDPVPVAVKLFRGAMTSDGAPSAEIATCLAAGQHPNLTAALGRLSDHPEGRDGLLMPLLPAHWRPLAAPPSLQTCSRDVYADDLRLSAAAALRIARGVASATAHLHARGLLHGDLYAHNVLWDGVDGEAALGDFGAASVLPADDEGGLWRRTEIRALGLLLEEVLTRCAPTPSETPALQELARDCVRPDAARRPAIDDVVETLNRL
ncbi:MAG TPA: leucine-rich repeat-containing protein kinase family protein [Methylocystis sp.]|nr:leucine-rich repeat-containing protein kinase family protein [Methylocystis sp.]